MLSAVSKRVARADLQSVLGLTHKTHEGNKTGGYRFYP